MAVSPLVSRRTPTQARRLPQTTTPLTSTAAVRNALVKTPLPSDARGLENIAEDVSSPAAAKARTTLVNSSFIPNIKTPVSILRKTPHIPLQKAVLLSAGECLVCVGMSVCV